MNNQEIIEVFFEGKKKTTRDSYYSILNLYSRWARNEDVVTAGAVNGTKVVSLIKKSSYPRIMKYINTRRKEACSSTVIQNIKLLGTIANHLVESDVIPSHKFMVAAKKIKRDKKMKRPTQFIPKEKVAANISAESDLKWKAILSLMFYTGMRRSELLKIDRTDFSNDYSYVTLRDTKNGTDRVQPIPSVIRPTIIAHVQSLPRDPWPQVFRVGVKKRMSWSTLYNYYKSKFNAAPHSARATVITILLSAGYSDRQVAEVAGHSSTSQIRVYDKRASEAASTAEGISY